MRIIVLFLFSLFLFSNLSYGNSKTDCKSDFYSDFHKCFGTYKWENGDVYTGYWENGKKHGKGTINYFDGNKYTGDWKNNLMDGVGDFFQTNGDIYSGEWLNGHRYGKGTYIQKTGDKYVGYWKNGLKEGKGKNIWINGSIFEGNFYQNLENGFGIMKYANGDIKKGIWEDGRFSKDRTEIWLANNYVQEIENGSKKHTDYNLAYNHLLSAASKGNKTAMKQISELFFDKKLDVKLSTFETILNFFNSDIKKSKQLYKAVMWANLSNDEKLIKRIQLKPEELKKAKILIENCLKSKYQKC